ncbi:HNH endonuclease signature motif containing protein, partial [Microbacterium gubbeenense]
ADLLRAGALADAKVVHGTRRAGVRVVTVAGGAGGYTEDGLVSLPQPDIDQRVCDTGTVPVTADAGGDPLNVGRERRLFTPGQRVALSVRDGGCRWQGCDRPASYCEAHHIDPYSEGGRTDIDRGILLCRFHHMQLHHSGWRISRDGKDEFVLHKPGGAATVLEPRLALAYAFGDVDPPPRRFRPAA